MFLSGLSRMEGLAEREVTNDVKCQPVEGTDYVHRTAIAGIVFQVANDNVGVGT